MFNNFDKPCLNQKLDNIKLLDNRLSYIYEIKGIH